MMGIERIFIRRRLLTWLAAAVVATGAVWQAGLACARPERGKQRSVFITGSSSGLGFLAGKLLVEQGHSVVLHARNERRAKQTRARLPAARAVVVGDVSTIAGMRSVARQVNALGRFDAIIHNVGVFPKGARRVTKDGLSQIFAVNVLAPYVLTALIRPPQRVVYLSSRMHHGGDASLRDLQWKQRRYRPRQAYSDTKLHDLMLALWLARHWPGIPVNALHPGWVPTRMGGRHATDNLRKGVETQVWLAVSDDPGARVTGRYFFHKKVRRIHSGAARKDLQSKLIKYLEQISGIRIPPAQTAR